MKVRFLMAVALLALGLDPAGAQQAARLGLAEALRAAGSNFDVAVARSGLEAARADVLAADHAPLPVLTAKSSQMDLQHGIGPGNLFADKRIDKSLGVDWTWERGHKRALRTAAARSAARAAEGDLGDTRRQQLGLTVGAFFDLLAAQRRVGEVGQLLKSAETLLDAMRIRHRSGDISAQDLSRAEIEAARARLDLEAATADRQRARIALARLTGLGAADLEVDDAAWPASAAAEPLSESQQADAVTRRPDVRAAEARVEAAQAALDGSLAMRQSDPTWGVSVDHFPGTSSRLVELRVQIPLQLGYQQQGEIGRAQAQLQQARDLAAKSRLMAEFDLRQAWQDLSTSALSLKTHEADILPRARQVAAQAELAYQKGALPLTDLIDARRSLRAAVLDGLSARADHARALGAWQLLTRTESQEQP
jgi:cobalt-zinc-cadmium efflux system outer membrane protein